MNEKLSAALIGAVAAVTIVFVRDFLLKIWLDSREAKRNSLEVFRRYADPLSTAAVDVLWRLDEILHKPGRGAYLLLSNPETSFNTYKRLSTTYRLAALFGWIRAFKRELSFLGGRDDEQIRGIKDAVANLEAGLADGEHIEATRLEALLDLWKNSFNGSPGGKEALQIKLERVLRSHVHEPGQLAAALTDEQQLSLCKELAEAIAAVYEKSPPNDRVIRETQARAVQVLSLRESWLYRDWQSAIGDTMLRETAMEGRLFEVIGFGDFEEIADDSELPNRWINRISAITDDLDVTQPPQFDARLQQLRNTIVASSRLIIALAEEDPRRRIPLQSNLRLARDVVRRYA